MIHKLCLNLLLQHVFFCLLRSQEWRLIGEEQRQEMGLTFSNDGEFWLALLKLVLLSNMSLIVLF